MLLPSRCIPKNPVSPPTLSGCRTTKNARAHTRFASWRRHRRDHYGAGSFLQAASAALAARGRKGTSLYGLSGRSAVAVVQAAEVGHNVHGRMLGHQLCSGQRAGRCSAVSKHEVLARESVGAGPGRDSIDLSVRGLRPVEGAPRVAGTVHRWLSSQHELGEVVELLLGQGGLVRGVE